jgi:hypothetical protein
MVERQLVQVKHLSDCAGERDLPLTGASESTTVRLQILKTYANCNETVRWWVDAAADSEAANDSVHVLSPSLLAKGNA